MNGKKQLYYFIGKKLLKLDSNIFVIIFIINCHNFLKFIYMALHEKFDVKV